MPNEDEIEMKLSKFCLFSDLRFSFSRRAPWALTALLAAALAACGGSDGGDAPAPTPTPPPAPSTPPASPLPTPQPAEWPLPQVTGGQAALLAGSLQSDTQAACGRVDAADPLQSRFGSKIGRAHV